LEAAEKSYLQTVHALLVKKRITDALARK